jgi:hypothetical protein
MKPKHSATSRIVTLVLVGAALVAVPVAGCVSTNNTPPTSSNDAGTFPTGSDGSVAPNKDSSTTPSGTDASTTDATSSAGDGSSGSCPSGWVSSGGVCVLNLMGSWAPSTDANSNGPDTLATLGTVTATSVSVAQSHPNNSGADCGCNSQHLNIPLGKTFQCATATLAFDYATTVVQSTDTTPAVNIRFCTGPCPADDGGVDGPYFYDGAQYVGSPFAPAAVSSCGYEWENDAGTSSLNYFPASALISATNTIPLGTYIAPQPADACTGSFDTIDVHMQVYNCFSNQTGTSTLSNLRIY